MNCKEPHTADSRLRDSGLKALFIVMAISAVVAVLDQVSKNIALSAMEPGEQHPVIPGFFNIVLVFNRGAAFGMFSGLDDGIRHYALGAATLLALCAVFYFLYKEFKKSAISRFALALILGGAVGNIIDRVGRGEVVDFLDFYFSEYHWPAFNVADSAICVGVGLLLLFGNRRAYKVSSEPHLKIGES